MTTGEGGQRNRKDFSTNTTLLNQRIVLNIGGQRFETFLGTLTNVPHTRLSWITGRHPRAAEYDHSSGEYFFDRHPGIFSEVLNYYRTGKLHCPTDVCASEFAEELAFWGINPKNMEPCCWVHYRNHVKNEKTLQTYVEDKRSGGVKTGSKKAYLSSENDSRKPREMWEKYREITWDVLEKPNSTVASKVRSDFNVRSVMWLC